MSWIAGSLPAILRSKAEKGHGHYSEHGFRRGLQLLLGQETLHSLVSVVDFSRVPPLRHARKAYGFYAVFLKDLKCGDLRYGRHYYDYQEGTLVFVSPGQVLGNDDNGEYFRVEGHALLFHPDLLRGTSLGRRMKDYTFFPMTLPSPSICRRGKGIYS